MSRELENSVRRGRGGDQGKEEGDRSVHERTVEWKPTSQQFVLS